jgi:hypothetical protein
MLKLINENRDLTPLGIALVFVYSCALIFTIINIVVFIASLV